MKETIYFSNLYDYYGKLLTEKQRVYFEDYYFQNLTLQEISENYQVSRNAVHKQLKEVEMKLEFYEEKLRIYKRYIELEKCLEQIDNQKLKAEIKRLIWEWEYVREDRIYRWQSNKG